jgi:hypothetical protein
VRLPLAALAALAAIAWIGLLASAPLAVAQRPGRARAWASAWTYRAGSIICHQQRDRSLVVQGHQMPVCARCAGLYAGGAIGAVAVVAWAAARRRQQPGAPVLPLTRLRRLAVACGAPTAVAWAVEHGGWLDVPNLARAAIALPLGAAVAAIVTLWALGAQLRDSPSATAIH